MQTFVKNSQERLQVQLIFMEYETTNKTIAFITVFYVLCYSFSPGHRILQKGVVNDRIFLVIEGQCEELGSDGVPRKCIPDAGFKNCPLSLKKES